MKTSARFLFAVAVGSGCLLLAAASFAANQEPVSEALPDLTELSVEQLVDLDLTSITKTSGHADRVPAAIYVLSNDDIRHSGATTIPEALRLVPGMHVAKVDGNKWSVSVRGFGGEFANKLLVLVDGRSVYTPLFSGTWWDQVDVMMEDIDRIEVIRGPGASLWGANAVNGVINIVTKKASDTQGTLASAHVGNERFGGGLRYGADLGDNGYLKVYGRHAEHDDSSGLAQGGGDVGRLSKIGFRWDKQLNPLDKLTLQGDALLGESGGIQQTFPQLGGPTGVTSQLLPTDQEFHGHNLLGRWEQRQSADSTTVLRMYWDRHGRKSRYLGAEYEIDTIDTDFQHNFRLNDSHMLIWGMGYRYNSNRFSNGSLMGLTRPRRDDRIYSVFVQDEITLAPNRWQLTLGSKLEHNPVTEFEIQPNARLLWTPSEEHSLWASISRSVRTPNWVNQDIYYTDRLIASGTFGNPLPVLVALRGNPNMHSENMLGYELGWRAHWNKSFDTDAALYYYDYQRLQSVSPGNLDFSTANNGYLLQNSYFGNFGLGEVFGGEVAANWQVSEAWRLRASYSHAENHFKTSAAAPALTASDANSFAYPVDQASLWSMYKLLPELSLDMTWRYVDSLSVPNSPRSYHEVDARLAWQLANNTEIALVGRSLLDSRHFEASAERLSAVTGVQREVYATFRWQF